MLLLISSWDVVASLPSDLLFFTQGQMKLTNRIVGKRKVSSRKRKKVEYRRTEGDPRNTQASFRLQDFKMWKFSMFLELAFYVLLLLALPPAVNSNETPTPRMCAVCLEKDCATGVRKIYPAGSDTPVWVKANSPTGIQTCSKENLKPDAPCKMANGILAQLADNPLHFDGIDTYGVRRTFDSQISPCDKLNLPPKPSPGIPHLAPMTKTPAAPNNSVADNKDCIGIGGGIGIFIIGIVIGSIVNIRVLIRKLRNYIRGLYRGRLQGNNRVPPHDAEDRDEITIEMHSNVQPLTGPLRG